MADRKPAPARRPARWVDSEPFDPHAVEVMTPAQERVAMASQWQMMWWKFRRHRLAVASGIVLALMYASILISEVLAPYNLHTRDVDHIHAPPQALRLFHDGAFVGPFVYGYDKTLDLSQLKRVYTENPDKVYPVQFFCLGDSYRLWGVIPGRFHLFCPAQGGTLYLLSLIHISEPTRPY